MYSKKTTSKKLTVNIAYTMNAIRVFSSYDMVSYLLNDSKNVEL